MMEEGTMEVVMEEVMEVATFRAVVVREVRCIKKLSWEKDSGEGGGEMVAFRMCLCGWMRFVVYSLRRRVSKNAQTF